MKRILLTPVTIDASGARVPTVPAGTTGWVHLHDFGSRMLIKAQIPDGTPKTATTIADITFDTDGRQVDVNAEPLTPAQRQTAKTFLSAQGLDVSRFDGDGIDDRAKLLRFILRRVAGWRDMTPRELLDGWDVA